jgi:hypothetical protein
MTTIAQQIEQELLTWPGVESVPHRFGGKEFRVQNHEIGHLHGSRLADLPFPRRVRDELIEAGRAVPHHVMPDSGWISFHMHTADDAQAVLALFRLNYERITAPRAVRQAD